MPDNVQKRNRPRPHRGSVRRHRTPVDVEHGGRTSTSNIDPAQGERVIALYCDAWSDPDAARRLTLLRQAWVPGGLYIDPTVSLRGRGALLAHIDRVLSRYPGARIERLGPADIHHGACRFAWRSVLPDGTALKEGVDFGEFSADGRLRRVVGFFAARA